METILFLPRGNGYINYGISMWCNAKKEGCTDRKKIIYYMVEYIKYIRSRKKNIEYDPVLKINSIHMFVLRKYEKLPLFIFHISNMKFINC